MKIVKKNLKNNEITLKVESSDDLWYLSQIITEKSIVKGKTYRKIQINDKDSERKQIYLEVDVEKVEFMEFSDVLKALGKITKSNDDRIGKGAYHSFNISIRDEITIEKNWSQIDFDYIKRSSENKSSLMIISADYGDATIAYYHDYAIEYSTTLSEELGGKRELKNFEKNKTEFIKNLFSTINELAKNREIKTILIGATGMMINLLKSKYESYDYLKGKTYFAKINYSNKNGIKELVKSGEAQKIIEKSSYYKNQKIVEEFLGLIGKSRKSTYGYNEVKKAVDSGAIDTIIITTNFISKLKQEKKFKEFDKLLKLVYDLNANISIIPSNIEAGEQIDNFSGIAAILRYNMD